MSTVEKFVDVNVPVRVAYDQWTQFKEFPKFMEGVRRVDQLDDKRMHWVVEIAGKTEERRHERQMIEDYIKQLDEIAGKLDAANHAAEQVALLTVKGKTDPVPAWEVIGVDPINFGAAPGAPSPAR